MSGYTEGDYDRMAQADAERTQEPTDPATTLPCGCLVDKHQLLISCPEHDPDPATTPVPRTAAEPTDAMYRRQADEHLAAGATSLWVAAKDLIALLNRAEAATPTTEGLREALLQHQPISDTDGCRDGCSCGWTGPKDELGYEEWGAFEAHQWEQVQNPLAAAPATEGLPKDYAQMWLDGGADPTFDQIDGFLLRHYNARAVYVEAAAPTPTGLLGCYGGQPHRCSRCGVDIAAIPAPAGLDVDIVADVIAKMDPDHTLRPQQVTWVTAMEFAAEYTRLAAPRSRKHD